MSTKFSGIKVAALAAAVALAMGSTAVMAAPPAATQLPGQGKLITTGTASTTYTTGSTMDIALTGNTVIDWNQGTDFNKGGVTGFNIGSGATVNFTGGSSVLNLDSTGNASQIFGKLTGTGNVFVANGNGIVVGATGSISSSAGMVGLIANQGAVGTFDGTISPTSFAYNGTGGDVTVLTGASLKGNTTVLVSGGGNVHVDLSALTSGAATLSAGIPQAGGAFATKNANAMLAVSGAMGAATLAGFASAGDASSSGALNLAGANEIDGTFINTGVLTLGAGFAIEGALVNNKTVNASGVSLGALSNKGEFNNNAGPLDITSGALTNDGRVSSTSGISVAAGDLTNSGLVFSGADINVVGGDLTNRGSIALGSNRATVSLMGGSLINAGSIGSSLDSSGNPMYGNFTALAMNGNINNSGEMSGFYTVVTGSGYVPGPPGSASPGFVAGADYSITNSGHMSGPLGQIIANAGRVGSGVRFGADNDSTGGFTNTGVLAFGEFGSLNVTANNDLSLGGSITVVGAKLSAAHPLRGGSLSAVDGVLTVATPLFAGTFASFGFNGRQVRVMADVTADVIDIEAGDKVADGYAVRVGSGVTLSATTIQIAGRFEPYLFPQVYKNVQPNVILRGTLVADTVNLGYAGGFGGFDPARPVSDVFTGPAGGIVATGADPQVSSTFTGALKTAPYLNDAGNFRFNGLPITVADADAVTVILNPLAYQTNGTSNGSAVNLLVNGGVNLQSGLDVPFAATQDSAVTGITNWPNTHLVLQSTGDISVNGALPLFAPPGPADFYWPGYVYLGTIAADADGVAQPGTLGFGQIALNGDFNNVLPGSVDIGGGVHFMTQFPLQMNSYSVTTNANAWVNFGTQLMTSAYASGTLGAGQFFGGVKGAGSVVNYEELDPAMFHTHAPVATK